MLYFFRKSCFGDRGLDQFVYLQGIRTQSIFIREQVRDGGKIILQEFWMIKGGGAKPKMMLQG